MYQTAIAMSLGGWLVCTAMFLLGRDVGLGVPLGVTMATFYMAWVHS